MEKRPVPEFIQRKRYHHEGADVIKVDTKNLASFWRAKEDIYKFLTEQKQYFLPSPRGCNISKHMGHLL
jgi:hypothetical protein